MPFKKGNQEHKKRKTRGGGRPRRATEEKFLDWFTGAFTKEDVDGLVKTGKAFAKSGNLGWAKLILSYLIGLPTQYVSEDSKQDIKVLVGWLDDDAEPDDPI